MKGGWGKVDSSIMWDSSLTPEARLIYAVLACHADRARECFPSINTLLKETGMSKSRFYKHMEQLEQRGIVLKDREKSGNLVRGTVYKLTDFP